MCKIYNTIGSLTTIKTHLRENNIVDFTSVKQLIAFQLNFTVQRQKINSAHELLIEQERNALFQDIEQLSAFIDSEKIAIENMIREEIEILHQKHSNLSISNSKNFFHRLDLYFRKLSLKKKIGKKERSMEFVIEYKLRDSTKELNRKTNRYQYIISNFRDAVNESSWNQISELERKKRIVDELNSSIYGALGEQKVVKKIETLSDENYLLNDFYYTFRSPLYNKREKAYIKTIQIDHILVSPSGVFLIETKNWSERSLNNIDLWSPVEQIKRNSFALFRLLANANLNLYKHRWGERKIPIRNLIVFTNQKPKMEFEHVKVLTLNELPGYINYFKPVFSDNETNEIANYLLYLMRSAEGRYSFDPF